MILITLIHYFFISLHRYNYSVNFKLIKYDYFSSKTRAVSIVFFVCRVYSDVSTTIDWLASDPAHHRFLKLFI